MKMSNRKITLLSITALAVLLAVLMAGCGAVPAAQRGDVAAPNSNVAMKAAGGDITDKGANNGISVSGMGSVDVKPDVAIISLGVETMDADAGKARTANDTAMAKVITAVKAFGVTDDDITTTNFNIYPRYDDKGQKITGYTVSNTVSVKVKSLDKLGDVLGAASAAGANTAGGISFDVLDRTAAYNQALAQAMDKAKARAEVMAKACGVTLGRAVTINESSSYSGPTYAASEKMNMATAAGDSVPVASGQLTVTANVSVVYEIVK